MNAEAETLPVIARAKAIADRLQALDWEQCQPPPGHIGKP